MKILITGATGFIGRALCIALVKEGHDLVVMTRDIKKARLTVPVPHYAIAWPENPEKAPILAAGDLAVLKSVEGVIHLAGESIAARRWTPEIKTRIRQSRQDGIRNLIHIFNEAKNNQLQVFITASGVGYYGDSADVVLTEASPPGTDFLAQVCQDWENSLFNSLFKTTRKVALRIGVVLGKGGGALEKMLPAFQAGVGGELGSGKQWMSWIHLEDLVHIFLQSIRDPKVSGPVNACAEPVTNSEFTKTLTSVTGLPSVMSVPGPLLKLATGEMSVALLSSQRAIPEKIKALNFEFRFPRLELALKNILGDSLAHGWEEFLDSCWVPQPLEKVFQFFSQAENLETITPPWVGFHVVSKSTDSIQKGTLIDYRLKVHGVPVRWRTEIAEWNPPHRFTDIQLKGPYQKWHHTHTFESLKGGTLIQDQVLYRLPLGVLGRLAGGAFVKKDVAQIFAYRTARVCELLSQS